MVGVVWRVESAIFPWGIPQKESSEIFKKYLFLYFDGRLIYVLVLPMKWACHLNKMCLVTALLTGAPYVCSVLSWSNHLQLKNLRMGRRSRSSEVPVGGTGEITRSVISDAVKSASPNTFGFAG
jgi:hypothetical protein